MCRVGRCAGLHPSQQLTKYEDRELASATVIQNDVAHERLSSQGSGDGTTVTDTADEFVSPTAATPPASSNDVADLYSKPNRMGGRRQARAEPDQFDDSLLQNQAARKPSFTGTLLSPLSLVL